MSTLVRKSIHVAAAPDTAFRVFTEMRRWWPLATHTIGGVPAKDAVVEPFVGGRWYERGEDGSTCDWGRVVAWEPPTRLVLTWEITADWRHDAALLTEVEVRFSPEGTGTRVDLEHRKLDAYGPLAETMRGVFDSEGGWTGLLAAFARAAE
ncbi:MAG: SRPBCC family protein [Myxococcota bacterium]